MSDSKEQEDIIDWAIAYRTSGSYPKLLSKDQKRAVRRRALTIEVDNGQVYVQKQKKRVKVIVSREEQVRILNSCHSDATSGHLGTRKTRRRIAERFYWKGLSTEVKEFVATCDVCLRMMFYLVKSYSLKHVLSLSVSTAYRCIICIRARSIGLLLLLTLLSVS